MHPKVTVIILNWNGWKDTLECLESLYQNNYPNYDVIIVDNNSEDNSVQKIKEYCNGQIIVESKFFHYQTQNKPIEIMEYIEKNGNIQPKTFMNNKKCPTSALHNLILINTEKNHGFAGGNNIAITYANNFLNSDYILLLNNDTVQDKEFLVELVHTAESNKKIGFVGAKTYFYNPKNVIQVAGGADINLKYIITLEKGLNHIDDGSYDKNLELDYIGGSCLLCRMEMLEKIGLMDTKYFMYWEDADWGFRGNKFGYKSIYSYKSKIWHKVGSSSKSYFQEYYFNRNRIYFMKKNNKGIYYIKFLANFFTTLFLHESKNLLINKRDMKGFYIYFKAIIMGIIT
ncbi:MAG: glycosyltransferase family 2 protein [Methanobacterium sp.]|nr:glycosyltransferase family 2 protein [Methanobacterium sp.]